VWYKFTTAASGLASTGASITVAGNVANQVRLFSAASCAGPFTELGCQAAATANTAAPALSTSTLTPSTTYYVRVASNSSGPFTICLTDGPGVPFCQPIVVGSPVYTNPDNTAATVAFTGHSSYLPSYTVFVRRYAGLSSSLVQTYTTSTVAPLVLTGLVPGTRYEVEVRAFCSNGGQTAQTRTFTVPAPNDDPCGAYPLLVDPAGSCSPLSGSAAGATATAPNGYLAAGCDGNSAPNDVWYTFQTALSGPASTQAVITLNNTSAAGSIRLFAAADCAGPFAEVACTAVGLGQAGPAALTATSLLPNTRYYVAVSLVDSPGLNRSADFTICVSVLPPILPCPALRRVVVGAIRQTTALLTVQLGANGRQPLSYTATYTPVGGPVTTITFPPVLNDPQDPFNVSYLLTSLLPNTAYTLTIVANCAGGNTSPALSTTFTTLAGPVITPGLPPANDHCATATLLTVGTACTPTAGTTLDATASAPGTPLLDCAAYPSPADVWYRLLVPASGTVQVRLDSVAGSGLRGASMVFYTGSCASLTQLQCVPGDGRDFANGWATGVPGSTLYVRVWAELSAGNIYPANGPFTICALDSPLPCPLVTGVAVSAITTTTASVAFVPGAGNIGFAVTATPVGGGPSVQESDASSPIALTGLQPGTSYLVTVASNCGTGSLGPGVQATFTTSTQPVTCPTPTTFYVGNITGTSASVNFAPVAGTTYVLTYTRAGGTAQTLPVTTSPVSLTGLLLNTTYTVSLQATCAVGPAPLATLSFSTTNGCAAPLFLNVAALTSTAATIAFAAPNGSSGYLATITPAGGTAQPIAPAPIALPFTITGLMPGTGYTVALQSACTGNTVSAPETVRFVTLTPVATCATPTGVSVTAGTGGTTATVQFTGPSGAAGYTVTATPTAGGNVVMATAAATPVQLTGLLPGTAYTVSVTTRCGAGTGSTPTNSVGFATPLASRNAALAATVGLFPNPAHQAATLAVPAALLQQTAEISLRNAVGQVVHHVTVPANRGDVRVTLNLANLPAGLYLVQLVTEQGPLVKRLVVE
jgi:hypothetical protein